MKTNLLLFLLIPIFNFTNIYKEKVTIEYNDTTSKYIFITQTFKSCYPCYFKLHEAIKRNPKLKRIPIIWINSYSYNVLGRKSDYIHYKEKLKSRDSLYFLYDDSLNSFLNQVKIEISPSLILFNKTETRVIHTSELFIDSEYLNKEMERQIELFFD